MVPYVALLVLETVLEGLVCAGWMTERKMPRKWLIGLAALWLLTVSLGLVLMNWELWVWGIPFVIYRLVNLWRLYLGRLPSPQLRTVCGRAYGWLVAGEALITMVAWVIVQFRLGSIAFDIATVIQLLGAIILLRASMHTWRHAGLTGNEPRLTDKQLPAVSVLVPARNETDDLRLCLEALVASNYPKLEILVLDDCSANRHTPDIIRSFARQGVRFLQGAIPDESRWLAKNFAYQQLADEASGDLLLFCGVDAIMAPDSIRQLVEILEARSKGMLSVMPLRAAGAGRGSAMLQAMRYYWEICLPRRFFKRPPVLSTCWLIRREMLAHIGGFESVSRSVSPEAIFARRAVTTDAYSFIRSDDQLGICSDKAAAEQYGTTVRVRYPQLHRRLELIALATLCELIFLIGPLVGLLAARGLAHTMAYVAVWVVSLFCLFTTYGLVSVGTRLTNPWLGWSLLPIAAFLDIIMLHISMWKYEFGTVEWKGRNACIPVMQVVSDLPKAGSRHA